MAKKDVKINKKIISLEIDHTVEIITCPIEAEEITMETIDQIMEVAHETTIDILKLVGILWNRTSG